MKPLTAAEWQEIYLALLPVNYSQTMDAVGIALLRRKILDNKAAQERRDLVNLR